MLSNKEFEKINQVAYEHAKREYEEVQYDKNYSPEDAIALGAFDDVAIADAVNNHIDEEKYTNEIYTRLYTNDITVFTSPGSLSWQGKCLYSPLIAYTWIRNLWR